MMAKKILKIFFKVNFLFMMAKTECFNTPVLNTTWEVYWCEPGCYYDSVSHDCKPCSPCHQMLKANPDGPVLQCQVDLSHANNLCAVSEMTFKSFLMEKDVVLPSLFVFFFILSCICCCAFNKWFYKPWYWRKQVQKTDRYNSRGRLKRNEAKLLYRRLDKVDELATELHVNIQDQDHGGVKYSRVETCYRYLWLLCNSHDCDITMIANALCRLGYAQLIYEIFTEQLVIQENCFASTPSTIPTNEHISAVYDRLNTGGRFMELQFLIAIELGLTLSDIDSCRSLMGALNSHVLYEIFKLWHEKDPSNYTVENINIVLQRVGIPEDDLLPCVSV